MPRLTLRNKYKNIKDELIHMILERLHVSGFSPYFLRNLVTKIYMD